MKMFETPEVEVNVFAVEDVITASGEVLPDIGDDDMTTNENETDWN